MTLQDQNGPEHQVQSGQSHDGRYADEADEADEAGEAEVALPELCSRIVAGAGRLSAAMCAWLLLIARFDAREAFIGEGFPSTGHWLSFACGIAKRTASDHVRVARCLVAHEALANEMSAGRLSYSQARATARVVHEGEAQLVADLIEVARYGTVAQLEALARGLRTVEDNETGRRADQADRELTRWWWDDASGWRLSGRLDPERGAVVAKAIETIAAREGVTHSEALVRLAEIGLATIADEAPTTRPLRGDEQAAVVIHLDASRVPGAGAAQSPGSPGSAESAESPTGAAKRRPYARLSDGGPGLPDGVVRRLMCAGRVRTVLHDGDGHVLDVGRSHRLVTDKQFRALLVRQQGRCAYPGCPNTKRLEAHHRVHWIDGGRTDLENLLLLCEPHHLAHHNGEFTIAAAGKRRFVFHLSDGRVLGGDGLLRALAARRSAGVPRAGLDEFAVASDAARSLWDGQRLDRGYAVSVLAMRRAEAAAPTQRVPA